MLKFLNIGTQLNILSMFSGEDAALEDLKDMRIAALSAITVRETGEP